MNSSTYEGKECPSGYYCPEGTTDRNEFPCPSGTYNPETMKQSLRDCQPCDPGLIFKIGFSLLKYVNVLLYIKSLIAKSTCNIADNFDLQLLKFQDIIVKGKVKLM